MSDAPDLSPLPEPSSVEASILDLAFVADLIGAPPEVLLAGLEPPELLPVELSDPSLAVPVDPAEAGLDGEVEEPDAAVVQLAWPLAAAIHAHTEPDLLVEVERTSGDDVQLVVLAAAGDVGVVQHQVTEDRVRTEVVEADDLPDAALDLVVVEPRPSNAAGRPFDVAPDAFAAALDALESGDDDAAASALVAGGAPEAEVRGFLAAMDVQLGSYRVTVGRYVEDDVDEEGVEVDEVRWVDGDEAGLWMVTGGEGGEDPVRVEAVEAEALRLRLEAMLRPA